MNERIKQLVGMALDKAVPYTWNNLDHVEIEKVMKEFAELIVRQCAKIVNDNDCEGSIVGDGMLFEHFGVEE